MPESRLSLSELWAFGATTVLLVVVTQLLLNKSDSSGRRRERTHHHKRSRQQDHSVRPSSSDDSDDDDVNRGDKVPAPPKPLPGVRRRKPSKTLITNPDFDDLCDGGWGFSMEDARLHAEQIASSKGARSPREVLEDLQKGNARFWTGSATRPEMSAFERRALIKQQFPSVAVLGCSDSRVPVEIVFDQGLGDMFVVRVAGNHLDTATTASLQYAIVHLKVKAIIVMGHEGCGAVRAAMNPQSEIDKEPEHLCNMLTQIKENLDVARLSWAEDIKAREREAVVTNVKSQVAELTHYDGVMSLVNERKLLIVGAFYEISSGIVDFFHEVSRLDDSVDALDKSKRMPSRGVQSRFDPASHEVTRRSVSFEQFARQTS